MVSGTNPIYGAKETDKHLIFPEKKRQKKENALFKDNMSLRLLPDGFNDN